MNSLEALEKIKWNVLTSTLVNKEEHLDLCEKVEKDLEVLEIIKKIVEETELKYYAIKFVVRKNELMLLRTFDDYIINSWKLTDLEEELLKEWLENE